MFINNNVPLEYCKWLFVKLPFFRSQDMLLCLAAWQGSQTQAPSGAVTSLGGRTVKPLTWRLKLAVSVTLPYLVSQMYVPSSSDATCNRVRFEPTIFQYTVLRPLPSDLFHDTIGCGWPVVTHVKATSWPASAVSEEGRDSMVTGTGKEEVSSHYVVCYCCNICLVTCSLVTRRQNWTRR